MKRTAQIVFNLGAGAARVREARRAVELPAEALEASDVRGRVTSVSGPDVAQAVREAIAARPDLILIGGGDGTIATAAGVLAAAGDGVPPLGILPLGTRNHFARDLGIPDLETAARVIAADHVVRVDVAEANGRVFINNASLGVYPRVVEDRARLEERVADGRAGRLRRAFLTLTAAAGVLSRLRLVHAEIDLDGRSLHARTPFVFVGNNPYEARLLASPHRPRLDRGLLEVVVARGARARTLLELAVRSAFGRLYQADEVEAVTARTARLTIRGRRTVRLALDGEVVRVETPITFRALPRALRVLAPPPRWGEGAASAPEPPSPA